MTFPMNGDHTTTIEGRPSAAAVTERRRLLAPEIFSFEVHAVAIHFADRLDRAAHLLPQLDQLGAASTSFVEPIRMTDPAGYTSPGIRSCVEAHVRSIQQGLEAGAEAILVLEDDVALDLDALRAHAHLIRALSLGDFDALQLGYLGAPLAGDGPMRFEPTSAPLIGSHAYVLPAHAAESWLAHLEANRTADPTDPDRCPTGPDGNLNTWSALDDVVRLVPTRSLADQFSSRSDITPKLWDRLAPKTLERMRSLRS